MVDSLQNTCFLFKSGAVPIKKCLSIKIICEMCKGSSSNIYKKSFKDSFGIQKLNGTFFSQVSTSIHIPTLNFNLNAIGPCKLFLQRVVANRLVLFFKLVYVFMSRHGKKKVTFDFCIRGLSFKWYLNIFDADF